MTYRNSILKGFSPQSEPHEKSTKYMTSPGQVRTQDLSRVKRTTSHYTTAVRVSAAKNAGCIRGAYLRRRLVSSKTIPATKKPLVKNFETSHVFQYLRKEIVSGGMGERHYYFLRLQKPFSRKVTDKEIEKILIKKLKIIFLSLGLSKYFKNMSSIPVSSSAQRFITTKRHIFLDAESYAEYISSQVNKLHFIKYP